MTTYRFPISVVGYIELHDTMSTVRVVVDKLDYDYAEWPRVTGNEDDVVVQIDAGHERVLSFDADVVSRLRELAELRMDGTTPWEFVAGAEDMIDGTMEP